MSRPQIIPLYTYDDYKLWEGKWELIAGHPVAMSPSPIRKHQRLVKKITYLLDVAINEKAKCDCEVLFEIDWIVDENSVLRPDITLVCDDNNDSFITQTPNLIVEVLSPSTKQKDVNTKYAIYEKEGVQYYLLVDPENDTIEVYHLVNDQYELVESQKNQYDFELEDSCKLSCNFSEIFNA